ncbi:MAG: 4Fe-4S binding protein [Myxococcales bacterium]|nr:4Fe-4S binding protein [Myxococcales bacterium]MCB9576984.1 4Fe-4S binding protein [Polyangiaceae bacterium]
MNRGVWSTLFVLAAVLCALLPARAAAETTGNIELDCSKLDCKGVLPGAVRFDVVKGARYRRGVDAAGKEVGWVVLSTDVVDIKGYSGKPLVTLVGLTPQGVISGAKVIAHSEPILLVGIPERKLHEFVGFYAGKSATQKIVVGSSREPDAVTVDMISGATVTVLAENRTILDTARTLGSEVGVVKLDELFPGHFVKEDRPWTWAEMTSKGVFGRLTVSERDMGLEADGTFIDLWFTIADAPQVGRALLGDREYAYRVSQLKEGEHMLVILGNGSSSFKGSAFVRGGIFDRVRVDQGLRNTMFTDHEFINMSGVAANGAPEFKESAGFIVRAGRLDPGAPFDLVFLGSHYNHRGGFSRDFRATRATFQLPSSVYVSEHKVDASTAIWRAAWDNHRLTASLVSAYLLFVALLFAGRRWLTANMARLKVLHLVVLTTSFLGLGIWLRAQPSVTQVLTLAGSAVGHWRWGLFLSEPLLFVSWIFIAVVTIAWGRGVFCGWVCPYGAMTELAHKLGRLLKLPNFELPERVHRPARYLRYVVLAALLGTFLYSSELGEKMAEVEPFKSTFYVLPWTRQWFFFAWWAVLLGASFVWWRPFCRYLCPLGAALALPSSFRISGPHRRAFCSSCTICTRGCEPRAIDKDGAIDSRDCLSCMECEANYRDQQVCPPLIGIERLLQKGEPDEERLAKLRQDATTVRRPRPRDAT